MTTWEQLRAECRLKWDREHRCRCGRWNYFVWLRKKFDWWNIWGFGDYQIESESGVSDTSKSSYDEEHKSSDYDGEAIAYDGEGSAPTNTQVRNKKEQNKESNVKWRKSVSAEVNSQFHGPFFRNPPVNDLDPRKYFEKIF